MVTNDSNDSAGKNCSICGAWKMLWQFENDKRRPDGHGPRCKWCIKQRSKERSREQKFIRAKDSLIYNTEGEVVTVKHSSRLIVFVRGSSSNKSRVRTFAYVICRKKRTTGALLWFSEAIRICRQPYSYPEDIAQQLSAESIHLALYRLGLGEENGQLDKMGLHTWESERERLKDYEGLAITRLGLRRGD